MILWWFLGCWVFGVVVMLVGFLLIGVIGQMVLVMVCDCEFPGYLCFVWYWYDIDSRLLILGLVFWFA